MRDELYIFTQPLNDCLIAARRRFTAHDITSKKHVVRSYDRMLCEQRQHLMKIIDILPLGSIDEYKIKFSDEEMTSIQTIGQLVAAIHKKCGTE